MEYKNGDLVMILANYPTGEGVGRVGAYAGQSYRPDPVHYVRLNNIERMVFLHSREFRPAADVEILAHKLGA